jgi:hypothetical protein
MTKQAWEEVCAAAARLAGEPQTARRLANLSMIAAAVHAPNHYHYGIPHVWGGTTLAAMLPRVVLHPLPRLRAQDAAWDRLAAAAARVAPVVNAPAALEAWVAEWQAAGEGRKSQGAYATPTELADQLARLTLKPLLKRRTVRVVDPSAGAGSLLLAALRVLAGCGGPARQRTVALHLYGAELDPDARELCCHLLWLASGALPSDLPLIAANIVVGDALSSDWWAEKARAPFDALLMNPPWESLRQALPDGHSAAEARRAIAERLSEQRPGAPDLPPLFSAQGRGDKNLYKGFVELAPHLLRGGGRLGALIPAALASDAGMAPLRRRYLEQMSLERWSVIENVDKLFPIDSRYKFGVLVGTRSDAGTQAFGVRGMCTKLVELGAEHVLVQRRHLEQLGGIGSMIPEVRSQQDLQILSHIAAVGSPFFEGGSLGKVHYTREVDLTLDRAKGLFTRWEDASPSTRGTTPVQRVARRNLVPLVEGRMVGQYDFFQKSWISGSGRTARWESNSNRSLSSCRPQFVIAPRTGTEARVAICDVTSATNTRTIHATLVPDAWWCGNTAPVLVFRDRTTALVGLAVLNSMIFDWIARRLVSGLHLNKFYLEAMWWPKLEEVDLQRLAAAALTLSDANPRFGEAGFESYLQNRGEAEDPVRAHVLIEQTVARSFGLTRAMVEAMLDEDRSDRRGMWRFYAAEPWARDVKRMVLDLSCPPRGRVQQAA